MITSFAIVMEELERLQILCEYNGVGGGLLTI